MLSLLIEVWRGGVRRGTWRKQVLKEGYMEKTGIEGGGYLKYNLGCGLLASFKLPTLYRWLLSRVRLGQLASACLHLS